MSRSCSTVQNENLMAIQKLKLIDDDFMDIVFRDKQCLELLLSIVLDEPMEIVWFMNQYSIKNLYGRDIRIDVFAKTSTGHYINVEVQRKDEGAHPKRARYHNSLIDANISFARQRWREIPPVLIIFISENDVLGNALPIYHINRIVNETGDKFEDETTIIYVNASIQDETPLGLLMHDFMCENYEDMHYEVLRKRVYYFKETEGGKQEMCEIFDEIRNKAKYEGFREGEIKGEIKGKREGKREGKLEGKLELIKKLMFKNQITFEEAMNMFDISIEEQQLLRKHILS